MSASRKKKKSVRKTATQVRREGCGKRYSEAAKDSAAKLYEEGMPLTEICSRTKMPNNTKVVRRWLVKKGIDIRSAKTQIYPRAKIFQQLEEGRPRSQIIEEFGCSTKYLSNLSNGKISP